MIRPVSQVAGAFVTEYGRATTNAGEWFATRTHCRPRDP
jgi:hypothetical protein